ncbi:MAG: ATP-grasp domain-containing protein [Gammaproteobacteria bacterium]|nr:MAG: ATP-grasp domain-containing protein [Gammaproteobacteria bacterium]
MKFCVIVDGYSTGGQYAELFSNKGYKCLHLQSNQDLPDFITKELKREQYEECNVHYELAETFNWIQKYGIPDFILPGSDSGVWIADKLSHEFGLDKRNSSRLSLARRDKFIMGETIEKSGLRSIKQIKTSKIDDIFPWMKEAKVSWPVVVKPLKSGSGEGFSLCQDFEAVQEAFSRLLSSHDLFNQKNYMLLIQEYIVGIEYVVNTVSSKGKHIVSEYCVYDKIINEEGNSLYKSTRFLSRNFQYNSLLNKYVFSVLDALEINYGPAHVEVMIDEYGPVLVEIGARPAGSNMDRFLLHDSYGHSQVDLSVLVYAAPEKFVNAAVNLSDNLQKELVKVYLMSDKNGIIDQIKTDKIRGLPSFRKIELHAKVGDFIKKAKNLEDIIGIVYLQHKEKNLLEKDLEYLNNIDCSEYLLIS